LKKSVFVSKLQISIDFTSQSVDTFWTFLVKVDTILCPIQERPARARDSSF